MDIQRHAVNRGLWSEGVWVTYTPVDDEPAEFLIAGWLNGEHSRAIGEKMLLVITRHDDESVEQQRSRVAQAYREAELSTIPGAVLRGWRGITSGGERVEFSMETAAQLLDSVPPLQQWVRIQAQRMKNYQTAAEVELGKSLDRTSPGAPESLPT